MAESATQEVAEDLPCIPKDLFRAAKSTKKRSIESEEDRQWLETHYPCLQSLDKDGFEEMEADESEETKLFKLHNFVARISDIERAVCKFALSQWETVIKEYAWKTNFMYFDRQQPKDFQDIKKELNRPERWLEATRGVTEEFIFHATYSKDLESWIGKEEENFWKTRYKVRYKEESASEVEGKGRRPETSFRRLALETRCNIRKQLQRIMFQMTNGERIVTSTNEKTKDVWTEVRQEIHYKVQRLKPGLDDAQMTRQLRNLGIVGKKLTAILPATREKLNTTAPMMQWEIRLAEAVSEAQKANVTKDVFKKKLQENAGDWLKSDRYVY